MGQHLTPRIKRPKGKVGAGGGKAVAERITVNGRGGRFTGTGTLTSKQRAFVREYVRNGGNGAAAMRAAGYRTAHPAKGVYRLLNCPVMRHAIHQEREKLIEGKLANNALSVLEELMNDKATPAPVRYQSARTVLQMAGHGAGSEKEAPAPVDRPLIEMSIEELEAFVKDGEALLRVAQTVARVQEDQARQPTIEGTARGSAEESPPDGS